MTTLSEPSAGAIREVPEGKGLKDGAIGFLSNTVIAIASVAPAYSLAAALGFVVLAVGLKSPIIMLLAFFPMMFIAVGYAQLNKTMPDCGTTFTWGTKAFGPKIGWMGGWGIIAADVIVMANLAQIAASYMFQLFGAYGLAADKWWTLAVGVAWIVVMATICYIGIEISAEVQYGLLAIELIMLIVFAITALTKVYSGSAPSGSIHPAWSWFDPTQLSFSALTSGMLLAIFIYWGWDTAVSVNEETRDKHHAPGRAAITSTVVLLVTYVLVTVAAEAFAGTGDKGIGLGNPDNSGDVLSVLGNNVFGAHGFNHVFAKLLVLMVLSSAAASTLTTILPTARTTLAIAAYRSIPNRFARIHKRYLTPTWSTVGMALASIGFYVLLTLVSQNVLGDTISALGLMIAFYYGLTGYACVWWFRRDLTKSWRDLLLKGIVPLLGAVTLTFFFIKGINNYWDYTYGSTYWTLPFSPHWKIGGVFLTGVGALVVGVILMFVYRFINPPFFKGVTLNKDTPVLVEETD
jgi:amino acid transporter